jgi:hypothetical protein
MKLYDGLTEKNVSDLQEGDPIEIIVRSDLYCGENEEPEYHSGVVTELDYQEFKDGTHPIGVWVKFNKDGLYEQDEEELVIFADIEYILKRNYEVSGVAKYQEYMTLSVKDKGIIDFDYQDGSLLPVTIREGANLSKREVTDEDKPFIREIMKYGAAMAFSRFVFCGDGNE